MGDTYIATLTSTVLKFDLIYFDSWWPMTEAAVAKLQFPDKGIYESVFFERNIKFQYPPISILPFWVVYKFDMSWERATEIANFVSYLSLVGIVVCSYQTIIVIVKKYYQEFRVSNVFRVASFLIVLIGTYSFYPVMWGQFIGQVQVIIDLLISMAFLSWLMGRKYFSGMMIALAALIKPQFALLLLWAALRKEKQFSIGLLLVFIPAGIISLAIFGFQEHLDYLRALSHMGQHGEVYWPNQSVNGLLNRLFVDATSLMWTLETFAPYDRVVHVGTLVSTVLFILVGLFYRRGTYVGSEREQTMGSALDLATMLLVCTIASPVAWVHHYGILMPVIAAAFLVAVHSFSKEARLSTYLNLLLLCISYFLLANYFSFIETEAFSKPPLNLLQSLHFYGALILLIALFLLRSRDVSLVKVNKPA
ncbi:glycosyltransferase family 87 protein [Sneathiella litorea]|uniref:glycosyltransferase family 87 protein n=1 Tax=Sneathiella litorea TaxID=2606216 RepID=UPI001BE4BEDD|nr:glycosyltransferase family 87 protein [Sneathiella litorea]